MPGTAHHSGGLHRLLDHPRIYEALQRLLGASAGRKRFVANFVRAAPGMKLLDIGCGTGALLEHLPDGVDYHGFDLNPAYIEAARARYGERGHFVQAQVGEEEIEENSFDVVVAKGILHHLTDDDAHHLLRTAARSLREGGVFVSLDGVFHEGQSRIARAIIALDRGRMVRTPEGYEQLVRAHFPAYEVHLLTDGMRIPYSYCIIRATKGGEGRSPSPAAPAAS
jgi:ubiquinone/menaquinone biosynthesis C-methylase UbiE